MFTKNKKIQRIALILSITVITILSGVLGFGNENITKAQSTEKELSGYAWSTNIGWISMNCSNRGVCNQLDANGNKKNYKVTLDEDTGNLTGYGWSSNVGWLKFGGLSNFPSDSSTLSINANIDPETDEMKGWIRFLSLGDGWDGWVSLSGKTLNNVPYGPKRANDNISGYAWGSDIVGWVDMTGISLSEKPAQCGSAHNLIIGEKPTTNLCDIGNLEGVVTQSDQDSWTWTCKNDLEISSSQCSSSCDTNEWICGNSCIPLSETCGDNGGCPSGSIEEPEGSGICVPNTTTTGAEDGGITTFKASPGLINRGDECVLNWAVYTETPELVLCEIVSDDGGTLSIDPAQGSSGYAKFNSVTSTTNYEMSCYDASLGTASIPLSSKSAKCVINPNFQEF